jgi:nucleoside-diphosphate-sugar epimerase
MDKKILLIAGGGTLGTYTSKELLDMGYLVDVICPEDKESTDERLRFFKGYGNKENLEKLFEENHYDSIVNFIHYCDVEDYKKIHPLLINNTDHLVFLSSYRVYADKEHPITENSPRLFDVLDDKEFFQKETYALPKALCEDFLKNECSNQPWTVVRPVISFSDRRLDFFTYSGHTVIKKSQNNEELLLPSFAKNLTAGIDWAGNSGKLIAKIAVNEKTIGEFYTISTGQNYTWGEVADMYKDLIGLKVKWVDEEDFIHNVCDKFMYEYDRKYNRIVDASKVIATTGIKKDDISSIYDGIKTELKKLGY